MQIRFYISCFLFGIFGNLFIDLLESHSQKMQAKYSVGDCLSNGLYYEKVVEIRTSVVLKEKSYVLLPTIQGKLRAPDTTAAWIVDEGYVLVSSKNCL